MAPNEKEAPARLNLRWAHTGGTFDQLLRTDPEAVPLAPPAPDEVIASVEAVSICSSDIKVVRMGTDHPLFAKNEGGGDTVLGHEMSLRVQEVGVAQAGRYRQGQRLALQPAMRIDGKRRIIGFDVPGGFAQYLRLGPEALADYVFEVPESLSAAEIALLEPYGCVERAYRPNARQALRPEGSALVVLGPEHERYGASRPVRWQHLTVVAPGGERLAGTEGASEAEVQSLSDLEHRRFDDILAIGELDAGELARLPHLLAEGGLLLQARRTPLPPQPIDAARIHYDALSFVGTAERDVLAAFDPARQRFDVKPGGVALVHGAGGAMGRIHVHRLLQLDQGPATIIATSRKGARLSDLEADFGPVAARRNRRLHVVESEDVASLIADVAPGGVDDAAVVAPDSEAVARVATWLAPDGLLAIFAGFPFGRMIPFDLTGIALTGKRITGSTGCSVDDMKDVLARVLAGELDLSANMKAVAGLKALPQALDAVNRGAVSGKIIVYPQAPDLPFRRLGEGWRKSDEHGLTEHQEPAPEQPD